MTRTAKEIFESFSERLDWDFQTESHVLVNWCLEAMIEPLLRHIEESGQTADFEEFLIESFRDEDLEKQDSTEPINWPVEGF